MSTKKDGSMICNCCGKDRETKDFLKDQTNCYVCVYREKSGFKVNKFNCRECGIAFMPAEGTKKKQRTVYCCRKCAEAGHSRQISNHWTKALRSRFSLFDHK